MKQIGEEVHGSTWVLLSYSYPTEVAAGHALTRAKQVQAARSKRGKKGHSWVWRILAPDNLWPSDPRSGTWIVAAVVFPAAYGRSLERALSQGGAEPYEMEESEERKLVARAALMGLRQVAAGKNEAHGHTKFGGRGWVLQADGQITPLDRPQG